MAGSFNIKSDAMVIKTTFLCNAKSPYGLFANTYVCYSGSKDTKMLNLKLPMIAPGSQFRTREAQRQFR